MEGTRKPNPRMENLNRLTKEMVNNGLIYASDGVLKARADIESANLSMGIGQWNFSKPIGVLNMMYHHTNVDWNAAVVDHKAGQIFDIDQNSFFRNGECALSAPVIPSSIFTTLGALEPQIYDTIGQKLLGTRKVALLGSITPLSVAELAKFFNLAYGTRGDLDLYEINAFILEMLRLPAFKNLTNPLKINPRNQTDLIGLLKDTTDARPIPEYDCIVGDVFGTYIKNDRDLSYINQNLIYMLKPGGILVLRDIGSKPTPQNKRSISPSTPGQIKRNDFIEWISSFFEKDSIDVESINQIIDNFWGDSGSTRHDSLNDLYIKAFKPWVDRGLIKILCDKNIVIDGVSPNERYLKTVVIQKI